MDLCSRSLQRHLSIYNTTFEAVMGRALTRHATTLLEQGEMQITQVALQLGYADPSHFVRAFRRWTGQTPGEFRRSLCITRGNMAARGSNLFRAGSSSPPGRSWLQSRRSTPIGSTKSSMTANELSCVPRCGSKAPATDGDRGCRRADQSQ
jgi:AraC-like DNA-binding protein